MATQDIEDGATGSNHPIGYSSFAHFIASDPELSIYRRFNNISSRNILYLQSELAELESQLLQFDIEDYREEKSGNTDHILSTRCWSTFASEARIPGREKEKMDLILGIRLLVKEYQEALILQSHVLNLEGPTSRVWRAFNMWVNSQSTKPLIETTISITHNRQDLVALRPAVDKDRLSRILQIYGGYASYIVRRVRGRASIETPVHIFSEDRISQIVTIISVSTASIILIGSIIGLYFVHSERARLGMIAGFTVLFALSISLFTNARRAETFAATAAYAAVLVVFVSGNLGGGNGL